MAKMTPEEIDREVERITREIRYEGFMKSRTWKNIKLAKLEAVGWKCERCGRDVNDPVEISLDVHHKTYERFGGDERMDDLEVLCRFCHIKHHGRVF